MTSTDVLPAPVDTDGGEDDVVHIACDSRKLTWCGQDSADLIIRTDLPHVDELCRICLAALELHTIGDPCPMCGTRTCLG